MEKLCQRQLLLLVIYIHAHDVIIRDIIISILAVALVYEVIIFRDETIIFIIA